MGRIGRVDAVGDGLGVATHDGERRPQLVGHVGQEAAAFALGRRQAGAHLVEGPRQRARLAWSALGDLHVEVTSLDATGGRDEVVDRLGQATQPADASAIGERPRAARMASPTTTPTPEPAPLRPA